MSSFENISSFSVQKMDTKYLGLIRGLTLTIIITLLAQKLINFPYLTIMGTMVIAILLGIVWSNIMGLPDHSTIGINYAAKKLLRIGIVLMGVRLNINEVIAAGPKIIVLDVAVITFTISFIYWLGRKLKVEKNLALLTAVGSGVCGAGAIAAVAPTIKANEDETAVAVATIAILGTVWTIVYTLLFKFVDLNSYVYGVFAGSTLHEVAHVIAAAQPGGEVASNIAILVKLGRVALLIPTTLLLGFFYNKESKGKKVDIKTSTIPWFIFGFLGVSILNSLEIIPANISNFILQLSVFLLTMAMAGMGLNVNIKTFRSLGMKSLAIGTVGSILLSILSFGIITLLNIS